MHTWQGGESSLGHISLQDRPSESQNKIHNIRMVLNLSLLFSRLGGSRSSGEPLASCM